MLDCCSMTSQNQGISHTTRVVIKQFLKKMADDNGTGRTKEGHSMTQYPSGTEETTRKSRQKLGPTAAPRTSIFLWEFLLEILDDPSCSKIVRWTDKTLGEFKFLNADEVARQWGIVKRRPTMDKIKMCRALRYYYKKGVIRKVKKPYTYKFLVLPYNHPTLSCPPPIPESTANQSCNASTLIYNEEENTWERR